MYFHIAKVRYLLYYSRIKTKPRDRNICSLRGEGLSTWMSVPPTPSVSAATSHLVPTPVRHTHQRDQQPAIPRSTTGTARNLVSPPNRRATLSPPSQTAPAAPAAAAVRCSPSQCQAVGIRAVTSKQWVVLQEVAAAAADSIAAARAPTPRL